MMLEPQYINSESVRTYTVGIDDVDLRATLANICDKIVWFDIPVKVNEVAQVNVLNTQNLWRKGGIRIMVRTTLKFSFRWWYIAQENNARLCTRRVSNEFM